MSIFYVIKFLVATAHQNLIPLAIFQPNIQKNILIETRKESIFSLCFLRYPPTNLNIRVLKNRKKKRFKIEKADIVFGKPNAQCK